MELLQTLRKIRACEGDAAAQLLLEAFVAQEVAAERERCKLVVQRAQYRNGHHTHEGTTMGHYDVRMIADIESGYDPMV